MNAVLDGVRDRIGAENCAASCSRDGCRVFLTDIPPDRVIADADKAFPAHGMGGKRCDFVLFLPGGDGNTIAAPIELKSGRVDVSDAAEQLNRGAAFAERFAPDSAETDFRPLLFHGRRVPLGELNRAAVTFRGRKYSIRPARCGRPRNLADALGL